MRMIILSVLAVGLAGCAGASMPAATAGSLAADREVCEGEAAAALYPSALTAPTPTQRTYPWTAAREWPQNALEDRLRERALFESCMTQRGHAVEER